MVVGSAVEGCQVVVIGAGPGGYVAAIRLAQLGKDVLLVEEGPTLGGVCLNEGCIPSKALIHAATVAQEIREAGRMGIVVGAEPTIDMPKLIAWKAKIVSRLTGGVKQLCKHAGVRTLQGRAAFLSDRKLEVRHDAGVTIVEFQQAIIATGTIRNGLPGFDFDNKVVIGSREALELSHLPRKLVVIGGGYIGLELGTVYRKLGAEVAVVEFLPEILGGNDPDIRAGFMRELKRAGIKLHTHCKATGFSAPSTEGGFHTVHVEPRDGKPAFTLDADVILVTAGRRPATRDLGLEHAGVTHDARGFIPVDEHQRTNIPGIYAIGDVTGRMMLAHNAYREAKIAAAFIAGDSASAYDNQCVPAVIYTDPEIAWVGLTAAEAEAKGMRVITGTFPLRSLGRAMTLNADAGLAKAVAEADSRRLLGMHLMGPNVSELVTEGALAIEMGASLDDLAAVIHPHPTMTEGVLEAVEVALGTAVHSIH